jgi:hypothetical protein
LLVVIAEGRRKKEEGRGSTNREDAKDTKSGRGKREEGKMKSLLISC